MRVEMVVEKTKGGFFRGVVDREEQRGAERDL